jgi:hypothetical protein
MPLLPEGATVLLELSLRFSDLRRLFRGEQVGDEQRPDLDMS